MTFDKIPCQKRRCLVITSGVFLLFILVIIGVAVSISLYAPSSYISELSDEHLDLETMPPSVLGTYSEAAVACDSKPCAAAGKRVLKRGGSAVDGAIATLLCMGVYTPQSSGIGGGFLMTIYNRSTGKAEIIDARETAPAFAHRDMYGAHREAAFEGGLSIAVPAEVKGMWLAHQRHGILPWKDLFVEAIELAENGFNVSRHMARALRNSEGKIRNSTIPSLKEMVFDAKTDKPKIYDDFVQMPQLAKTLRKISEEGPAAIYEGPLAKMLVDDIRKAGGNITLADLKNYEPLVKEAVNVTLKNGKLTLFTVPPPGSGAILCFLLKVFDGYGYHDGQLDAIAYQRLVEAFKYAYGYRPYLGDDQFYADVKKYVKQLLSPDFAAHVRGMILDDRTFDIKHYTNFSQTYDHGTAHMAIVASNGDAVSATSTVNYWFGSGVLSPQTGILLNNEMDDFSAPGFINIYDVPPAPANFIHAGKRPLSSMTPAIFVDSNGDARLVIGAAGGTRITTSTALVSSRILYFDEDVKVATDAARIHHQLMPNTLEVEVAFDKNIKKTLKTFGHETKDNSAYGSVVVGIQRRNSDNKLLANYDFRKGGSTDGF